MKFLIPFIILASLPAQAVEEYILDGFPEAVSQDTLTPANSRPFPSILLNPDGTEVTPATQGTLASILAVVSTENTLTSLNSKFGTLGQKTMAGSAPVVIASDQSTLPISAASLPLPAGASTEAKQDDEIAELTTANASLAAIESAVVLNAQSTVVDGATPSARTTMVSGTDGTNAQTLSVTSAGALNVVVGGTVPLPTGAATEATLSAMSAKLPAAIGQTTESGSLSVVLASDQPAIPVTTSPAANTATFDQITNLTTVAQTFTAPANAVGFKIQAPSTNTANITWRVNGTATATEGILMEPGRSEDFDAAGNISVIAVSGTNQVVTVQWKVHP
jgi:hypothetical protein